MERRHDWMVHSNICHKKKRTEQETSYLRNKMDVMGDCGSLALWILKPGSVATKTRQPRPEFGPFPLFLHLVLLDPGSEYRN